MHSNSAHFIYIQWKLLRHESKMFVDTSLYNILSLLWGLKLTFKKISPIFINALCGTYTKISCKLYVAFDICNKYI